MLPIITNLLGSASDTKVEKAVKAAMRRLVPPKWFADSDKMMPIDEAVRQLCKAKSVEEIDWLGVVNLAANIARLYESNALND